MWPHNSIQWEAEWHLALPSLPWLASSPCDSSILAALDPLNLPELTRCRIQLPHLSSLIRDARCSSCRASCMWSSAPFANAIAALESPPTLLFSPLLPSAWTHLHARKRQCWCRSPIRSTELTLYIPDYHSPFLRPRLSLIARRGRACLSW